MALYVLGHFHKSDRVAEECGMSEVQLKNEIDGFCLSVGNYVEAANYNDITSYQVVLVS